MDIHEAMRTGLPIAIGGVAGGDPDDREDGIEARLIPDRAPDVTEIVEYVGEPPAEALPPPQTPPSAPPAPLNEEVENILVRIEKIEEKIRKKLGLDRVHEALNRVEALLN